MGHHIDALGRFQSDKHPDLPPDKIILSFHDVVAAGALRDYARRTLDAELAEDIEARLNVLWPKVEPAFQKGWDDGLAREGQR